MRFRTFNSYFALWIYIYDYVYAAELNNMSNNPTDPHSIGIDLGYEAVKVVTSSQRVSFPSIVGTPEQSTFKLGAESTFVIRINDRTYNVGEAALEQSRFTTRQEDRDWYNSQEYLVLLHGALSSLYKEGHREVVVVTGLPVAFYESDKQKVRDLFESDMHIVMRDDNPAIPINVLRCFVIPQVMGTLLNEALNDTGQIANQIVAEGRIGVIDIGGNTTNFLHAHKMGDVKRETTSINLGGWDAMRAVRPMIEEVCPDVEYADHEISRIIAEGLVKYRGEEIDLSDRIATILDPMAEQLIAKAKELWPGGGARLDSILLSGGGSLVLGERIKTQIDHTDIRVVEDAIFANANGYYKLAKYRELSQ